MTEKYAHFAFQTNFVTNTAWDQKKKTAFFSTARNVLKCPEWYIRQQKMFDLAQRSSPGKPFPRTDKDCYVHCLSGEGFGATRTIQDATNSFNMLESKNLLKTDFGKTAITFLFLYSYSSQILQCK